MASSSTHTPTHPHTRIHNHARTHTHTHTQTHTGPYTYNESGEGERDTTFGFNSQVANTACYTAENSSYCITGRITPKVVSVTVDNTCQVTWQREVAKLTARELEPITRYV